MDLTKSRIAKDFGKGFYLSPSLQNAKDWAERVTQREESGVPTVTMFKFDERNLDSKDLKVRIFNSYNLDWIDFILLNRQNKTSVNLHDYDIVTGPIADDSVGTQLFLFNRGYIDKNTLIQRLKGNKPKFIQYFFATEKAVKKLVLKDE
ncbi:MAG: DUF3990 domain-containing protein [Bacteroidia bacterium]|nr:DUF3990 domain-containing protein [Bacteroidia bacterium]